MTRSRPTLTIAQYREAARLLQVEVSNVAWSLVVSPSPIEQPRRWRPLTARESEELFDRLLSAVTRFNTAGRARIEGERRLRIENR
jgi:hypothetical protein